MTVEDLKRAVVQADIADANLPANRFDSWGQITRRHADIAVRTVLSALADDLQALIRLAGEEGVRGGPAGRIAALIAEAGAGVADKPSSSQREAP